MIESGLDSRPQTTMNLRGSHNTNRLNNPNTSGLFPLAVKSITAQFREYLANESISNGVTAFETFPVQCWCSMAAKCAAVRAPPEPTANKGSEAVEAIAFASLSIFARSAQEYVPGRALSSFAYNFPKACLHFRDLLHVLEKPSAFN